MVGEILGGLPMTIKNCFQSDEIEEIATKLIDPGPGNELSLIIVVGGPGVGKSTMAREFVRQTNSIHFEIDEIKRQVVPEEVTAEGIAPLNTVISFMLCFTALHNCPPQQIHQRSKSNLNTTKAILFEKERDICNSLSNINKTIGSYIDHISKRSHYRGRRNLQKRAVLVEAIGY